MVAQFAAVAVGVPEGTNREERLRELLMAALHELDER
jgi:hypothetical protein